MFQTLFIITFFAFAYILVSTIVSNYLSKIPFVPSRRKAVDHLLKHTDIKNGANIYDLGCGDGRILFKAEKKAEINGTGYEIALLPYLMAKIKKLLFGSKVNIKRKNFLNEDLSNADIVFCYLFPNVMSKIADKIKKECKIGTKIVSHTFKIKDMEPVKVIPKTKKHPQLYIYEIKK